MNDIYNFVKSAIDKSKAFKGGKIDSILDFPTLYCVSYLPKGSKVGDQYDDAFLSVDKKTGKVSAYNPLLDIKSFTKANKNPIYVRSKDIRRSDAYEKGKELVHSMLM